MTAKTDMAEDRRFVSALGRGLELLNVCAGREGLWSHRDVCAATGFPKATVTRLIYTLLATDYLVQEAGAYRLGPAAARLAEAAAKRYDIAVQARPLMEAFALRMRVSVSLAREQNGEMLYLACVRSPARVGVQLQAGSTVPLPVTAIGRACYAAADAREKADMVSRLPGGITDRAGALELLERQCEFFKAHGYTLSDGEFSPDITAVAVGVYNPLMERFTHALNAGIPAGSRTTADFVAETVPELLQLSRQITALLHK